MFYSARTVGNGGIQHLFVVLTCPDVQSVTEYILPNIIERKCGVARKTRILINWPLKKKSHVFMSSNAQTAKEIIKWTVLLVHFGKTVSIGIGMVENNRNSFGSKV